MAPACSETKGQLMGAWGRGKVKAPGKKSAKKNSGEKKVFLCFNFLNCSHYYLPLEDVGPVDSVKIFGIKFPKIQISEAL